MAKRRKNTKRYDSMEEQKIPRTRKPLKIESRTQKQREYIRAVNTHDITFGIGSAGTGKSFLAALLALQQFINGEVDKIVICRPAVTAGGEDLGFLPGGIQDKMDPFIQPIFDAFKTYWNPHTIKQHLADGNIEIVPLAYMRGRSFTRSVIIADEMQNSTTENLLMLLTRLGEDSKIIITGDPSQSDVNGQSCFHVAKDILHNINDIAFVHFNNSDVIRHPTVKKILEVWPDNGITEGGDFSSMPKFVTAA